MGVDTSSAVSFGCPVGDPEQRRALLTRLWRQRARDAALALSGAVASEVRARSVGLLETCQFIVEAGAPAAWLKGFPIGLLEGAARTSAVDPALAAANAAAHLSLCGVAGQWSVRPRAASRLLFGRWATPPGHSHTVCATGRAIVVETTLSGAVSRLALTRASGKWAAQGAFTALPAAELWGTALPVYFASELDLIPTPERLEAHQEPNHAAVAALEQAARLITRHASAYASWVGDIVAGVIPLVGSAKHTTSSTHPRRFSIIAASTGCRPVQLAEAFVRQSSHEYFHMAERLHPLEDGSDPLLYYSPLRKCGRPIRSIYLAFHAIANVMFFYRACSESGYADDGDCSSYSAHHARATRDMLKALRTSPAVTKSGRRMAAQLGEELMAPRGSGQGSPSSHVGRFARGFPMHSTRP